MTASFKRRRRCIRPNDAAIAGVMLSSRRIGNSGGLFASADAPLDPGEAPGACVAVPAGVPRGRAVSASARMAIASCQPRKRRGARNNLADIIADGRVNLGQQRLALVVIGPQHRNAAQNSARMQKLGHAVAVDLSTINGGEDAFNDLLVHHAATPSL